MKFGYAIIYCADVLKTVAHYEQAFGLRRSFIHESQEYAEMATGDTILAFASNEMADTNGIEIRKNAPDQMACGFEVALVDDDVAAAYETATANGAVSVKAPHRAPWGQTVAYVCDINGCLVALVSSLPKREV